MTNMAAQTISTLVIERQARLMRLAPWCLAHNQDAGSRVKLENRARTQGKMRGA